VALPRPRRRRGPLDDVLCAACDAAVAFAMANLVEHFIAIGDLPTTWRWATIILSIYTAIGVAFVVDGLRPAFAQVRAAARRAGPLRTTLYALAVSVLSVVAVWLSVRLGNAVSPTFLDSMKVLAVAAPWLALTAAITAFVIVVLIYDRRRRAAAAATATQDTTEKQDAA
jgi:uncharacterized membrane protein